jgi:hypothetical protein
MTRSTYILLQNALTEWDGSTKSNLTDIYHHFADRDNFSAVLISAVDNQKQQNAATWLIKFYLTQGNTFPDDSDSKLLDKLCQLKSWQSKLHMLQSIQYIRIDQQRKRVVERFIRKEISSENKFVRAWSYSAFYFLCLQYPEYQSDVRDFFRLALADEPASVTARIRNILKRDVTGIFDQDET